MKKIVQNGLKRRVTVALAGAGSGARLLSTHTSSIFRNAETKALVRSEALAKEAQTFTRTLGELKGAYVKIGQIMAMYGEHLLPTEVTAALRELENQTQPLPWSAIHPVVEQELGTRLGELEIIKTPIAAASLSQVHLTTLKSDGASLCLKVQYPGVAKTINSDFELVLQMLKLTRWVPNGRNFEDWVNEIKDMLHDEVDYQREATMMRRVAKFTANDPRFRVPILSARYSSRSMIAMEYLPGEIVSSPKVARLSLRRRNELAYAMLENFFNEVFDWGVMQTDPNFGNYLIKLGKNNNEIDQLILLDFGAVRELPTPFRKALQKVIVSAHTNNREGIISGAIELGCLMPDQSRRVKESFADFCVLLVEPFKEVHDQTPSFALSKKGKYDWQASQLIRRVGKAGAKALVTEGFSSPPKEFALIARKLTGVFTFIATLRAEFNAYPIIQKYL